MKKLLSFAVVLTTVLLCLAGCGEEPKINSLQLDFDFTVNDTLPDGGGRRVKVILLAGQSNATGVAHTGILKEKVPADTYERYVNGPDNVHINYNTENGANRSDGFVRVNVESYFIFGPEVGMAERLGDEADEYFIIKYSYGGSNLYEHWKKENECLYKGFMTFTGRSLDYLKSKNYDPEIVAMCWMQGESDAFGKTSGKYYDNTKKFVGNIRSELGDILWVDAGISDSPLWKEYETVNRCKQRFCRLSDKNIYIDTIGAGLTYRYEPADEPDLAHYDSLSQIELGQLFAEAILAAGK